MEKAKSNILFAPARWSNVAGCPKAEPKVAADDNSSNSRHQHIGNPVVKGLFRDTRGRPEKPGATTPPAKASGTEQQSSHERIVPSVTTDATAFSGGSVARLHVSAAGSPAKA